MPIHEHQILPAAILIIALLGSGCGSDSELKTTVETTEPTTEPETTPETTAITLPSSTTISTTTVTSQPTVTMETSTATTTTSSPTNTLPVTTVTAPETGDLEPYVFVLAEFFLVNLSDRSTPIGTLCWAMWEWSRMHSINVFEVMADQYPRLQIVYPADYDHEYTLIDALEEISKPEIVSIADSPQFSKELQLFAKAFFEQVRTDIKLIDVLTSDQLDYSKTDSGSLEKMPHLDSYHEEAAANSDQCIFSEDYD